MIFGNSQLMKSNIPLTIDGKYIFAASVGTNYTSGGYGRLSTDYGATMQVVTGSSYWLDCDISSNGEYAVMPYFVGINQYLRFYNYFSAADLVTISGIEVFSASKISGNGQYWLIGAQDGLGLSSNYGVSASKVNAYLSSDRISSLAISYTGQYMLVGGSFDTKFYQSSDYGVTWSESSLTYTATTLDGAAMSHNGQYRTVFIRDIGYYYSHDYGVTWTISTGISVLTAGSKVDISANGQYQLTGVNDTLYKSTDYGVSFTVIAGITSASHTVNVSGTGKIMIAGKSVRDVIKSTDYGITWSTVSSFGISRWRNIVLNKFI
jgi:hypothetical protein